MVCSISGADIRHALFCVLRLASDQCFGDVIAVAALAFCCSLHVQRLAAFVEQLARQRTARCLGLAAFAAAAVRLRSCCWTRSQSSRLTIASCCPGWRSFLCRISPT